MYIVINYEMHICVRHEQTQYSCDSTHNTHVCVVCAITIHMYMYVCIYVCIHVIAHTTHKVIAHTTHTSLTITYHVKMLRHHFQDVVTSYKCIRARTQHIRTISRCLDTTSKTVSPPTRMAHASVRQARAA